MGEAAGRAHRFRSSERDPRQGGMEPLMLRDGAVTLTIQTASWDGGLARAGFMGQGEFARENQPVDAQVEHFQSWEVAQRCEGPLQVGSLHRDGAQRRPQLRPAGGVGFSLARGARTSGLVGRTDGPDAERPAARLQRVHAAGAVAPDTRPVADGGLQRGTAGKGACQLSVRPEGGKPWALRPWRSPCSPV